jgi:hypothetical protein
LDVVEELSPLRRLHQGNPENGHHAKQQNWRSKIFIERKKESF